MKKTLLLAGAACLFSFTANAAEYRPYVGADYVFSHGNIKKQAMVKENYHNVAPNVGVMLGQHASVEAFYQWAFEKTKDFTGGKSKSEFYGYGIDLYGYMPVPACNEKFSLLGSLGIANYKFKNSYKEVDLGNINKQRVGYRAGIGAQYNFNDNIAARVMARYTFLDTKNIKDLQELTAGLRYTF